jgi:amino acid transporter
MHRTQASSLRSALLHLPRALLLALLTGVGAAVIVAIALGDSVPWMVKIPVALVGGGTIGLIGAGYAALGSENEEG